MKRGLSKVEEGLKECGFEDDEIQSFMIFLKNYLQFKKNKS